VKVGVARVLWMISVIGSNRYDCVIFGKFNNVLGKPCIMPKFLWRRCLFLWFLAPPWWYACRCREGRSSIQQTQGFLRGREQLHKNRTGRLTCRKIFSGHVWRQWSI
jgi:hypothetical protein